MVGCHSGAACVGEAITMRKIVGAFLLCVVFTVVIGMCVVAVGIKGTLVALGTALLLAAMLIAGITLLMQ